MYIYIFGSICRGEIDKQSDIDLLAIVDNLKSQIQFDTNKFSVYTIDRLKELWKEGNPFAWHLFLESKLIYSENDFDIIKNWGAPNVYSNLTNDLAKFSNLFKDSVESLKQSENSKIFDLSMIFLSVRNFASCYSLGYLEDYNFSRDSALNLNNNKLKISNDCYKILERARILSTRGTGPLITKEETKVVLLELDKIEKWFQIITKSI